MLTQQSISRKDFLMSLGFGGAALMAVLASCKNSTADAIIPAGGIQIDLTTNLLAVGSYIYNSGIIIARVAAGNAATSFAAVSQNCTHEGTTIMYQGSGIFHCPNHGAEFNTSGGVTRGPATSSLKSYTETVSGTTLSIT
jgi:cytochrome b6-f complex iron-sulfur subunit